MIFLLLPAYLEHKNKKMSIVNFNENVDGTAAFFSHQLGHAMGIEHDFFDTKTGQVSRRKRGMIKREVYVFYELGFNTLPFSCQVLLFS